MSSEQWFYLLLLFARFTAAIAVLPIFSMRGIPVLLKAGFGAVFAYLLFMASPQEAAPPPHLLPYVLTVASEVLVGLTLGLLVLFFFTAARIAGQFVDLTMGLAQASIFDPQYGSQVTLFGQFYYLFALALYFSVNGHHYLFKGLAQSIKIVPPGGAVLQAALMPRFLVYFSQMFTIAFQLAAPVIVVLVISELALGLLGKTVPQLNVFMVGMPLKVGVGLLVIYIIFPYLAQVVTTVFDILHQNLQSLLALL